MASQRGRQRLGGLFVVALALLCAPPTFAHDPIRFDSRRVVPGATLEIVEVSRAATAVKYRLKAAGVPRGLVTGVWANEFGHGYHELVGDLRVDDAGDLVSAEPGPSGSRKLDDMLFEPDALPSGAGWEVAIVTEDRKIVAYAKVIPHPIVGRSGPCSVSLELASRRGERFIVSGAGFTPGERVMSAITYGGRTIEKSLQASSEGRLPRDIIAHSARLSENPSRDDRTARYVVTSRSCEVTVEYEWGVPVLGRP